jgi:hypothetical protein
MSLRSPVVGALAVFALVGAMAGPLAGARAATTAAPFSLTVNGDEMGDLADAPDVDQAVALKKLPGKRTPPTVTLKRGMTKNIETLP